MLVAVPQAAGTNNFLIPNGTFFFELLCFLVVLWILGRKIVPRISEAIEKRQETIRQQFEEAKAAREAAEKARADYQEALAETRKEITRLREEAQAEGAQILTEYRERANAEYEERIARLQDQLASERQQILLSLRQEIGELAFTLSEKMVHEALRDEDRQRRLVDDFIAGVGSTVKAEAEAR
jgi:F-type H+-transporting ATPase subunit b